MEKNKNITKWLLPGFNRTLYEIQLPSKKREWMDCNNSHAYKCLPLVVANGFGWEILNPVSFDATWNGSLAPGGDSIKFNFYSETEEEKDFTNRNLISSHFGNGIITFSSLNFIMRTTKDHNIFLKGPTNLFKHGAHALEAIMESDWLPYTFTLNWKITAPDTLVKFEKGEPLACMFPFPRNYLESFEAVEVLGDEDSEFNKQHRSWAQKRAQMKGKQHLLYTKGLLKPEDETVFEDHQKSITGCPFAKKND
jgi:hypothetical protein